MFTIEDYNPSKPTLRNVGVRQEIFETMEALKLWDSFFVPVDTYAHVSVRARVSEYNKTCRKENSTRKYRAHFEEGGTRVARVA
jgi:hypothetical protein